MNGPLFVLALFVFGALVWRFVRFEYGIRRKVRQAEERLERIAENVNAPAPRKRPGA